MRVRSQIWLGLVLFSIIGAVLAPAAYAIAPVVIVLNENLTLKSAQDLADRADCTAIPGGAKEGADGWVFAQPLADTSSVTYSIGFLVFANGGVTVVVFAIDANGIRNVPLEDPPAGAAAAAAATVASGPAAAAVVPGAGVAAEEPVPDGVAGALIDNGAGGVWLQTPAGWVIAAGALGAFTSTENATTFDLAAVCLPKEPAQSPAPSPSPSSSAPAGGIGGGGALPVTGNAITAVALIGGALLLLGLALRSIRRRTAAS